MPRPAASPVDKVPTLSPQGFKRRTTEPVKKGNGGGIAKRRDAYTDTSKAGNAELVDVDKPLTEKQKLFIKHWAAGDSILGASYRAGYSDNGTYAYRMVKQPNILVLYQAEKAAYEEAAQMSRKKVMDMLLKAYDHAELAGEPASMVSAAREVGRMCGYYEPVKQKIDITVNGSVIHRRMESMSDSELLELITSGKALGAIEGKTE